MLASAAQAFSLRLERTLEFAGAFLLALLLGTVTLSVVLRYAAASGFTGAEEAASWLLVALVSVGLPLASTTSGLRIDLFEGGAASRHSRDHAQTVHGSLQIVGEGAKPSFRLRRLAPRHLRVAALRRHHPACLHHPDIGQRQSGS